MQLQIDVIHIKEDTVVCNLYTQNRCVKVIMIKSDYEALKRDGFFIRKGDTVDSAAVWNTTKEYAPVTYSDGHMVIDVQLTEMP